MDDPEGFLRSLFSAAVAAASDFSAIPDRIPRTKGRVRILAAGKAAAAMAAAIEVAPPAWLRPGQMDGLVITPPGHDLPLRGFEIMVAGHPVPDAGSLAAGERMLSLAGDLTEDDLLVALISGGASALLAAPVPGLTLDDEIALNRRLMASGLPIAQINAARVRLSRIKGGGLANAAAPARVVTFVLSDVPGDDLGIVGSGPTLAGTPTELAPGTLEILGDHPARKPWTSGPGEAIRIGGSGEALSRAEHLARARGVVVINLGPDVEGDARVLARDHVQRLQALQQRGRPCLLLSGGEATVTMTGGVHGGRGGRNSEYLAALLDVLGPEFDLWAIAADTDGIDGTGPAAGGILRPDSYSRLIEDGVDLGAALRNHDTLPLIAAVGGLVQTGPTRTNVNDFRALLVL